MNNHSVPCTCGSNSFGQLTCDEQEGNGVNSYCRLEYDPTPWCSGCGAMREADCNCGPIADNN